MQYTVWHWVPDALLQLLHEVQHLNGLEIQTMNENVNCKRFKYLESANEKKVSLSSGVILLILRVNQFSM